MSYANGMNLNLIEGSFGGTGSLITPTATPSPNSTQLATCFPAAKLGRANYFYVYESAGYNFYGLVGMLDTSVASGVLSGTPAMSVLQAYTIDKKVDDGFPTTGTTQVNYLNAGAITQSNGVAGASGYTATTCYDSTALTYATSSTVNGNGTAGLCALSFRFQ